MAGRAIGFATFHRDMLKLADRRTIAKHVIPFTPEIFNAIRGAAKAGEGPDGAYAPYSKSYATALSRKGIDVARKLWLLGAGPGPHMLDSERFSTEIDGRGVLTLVWTSAGGNMDQYGAVHQGTAHGGQTHTRGHVPPRPWFHLDVRRNRQAAVKAWESGLDVLCAEFNAGYVK